MTLPNQHVFLIRTPTGLADSYNAPLSSLTNDGPTQIPLLTTAYPSTDQLAQLLATTPSHQNVVITSARSIHALQLALDHLASINVEPDPAWAVLNWFVVGRPTREALIKLGPASRTGTAKWKISQAHILGDECGCADNLGPFIIRHLTATSARPTPVPSTEPIRPQSPTPPEPTPPPPPATILYLTGDKNRDTLDLHLAAGSADPGCPTLQITRIRTYETAVAPDFPARLEAALAALSRTPHSPSAAPLASPTALWIVLFSPSGAAAVVPELRRLGLVSPPTSGVETDGPVERGFGPAVRLVAIGPTTRSALEGEQGVACAAMAATPDPEGVKEAIRLAGERESSRGLDGPSQYRTGGTHHAERPLL